MDRTVDRHIQKRLGPPHDPPWETTRRSGLRLVGLDWSGWVGLLLPGEAPDSGTQLQETPETVSHPFIILHNPFL